MIRHLYIALQRTVVCYGQFLLFRFQWKYYVHRSRTVLWFLIFRFINFVPFPQSHLFSHKSLRMNKVKRWKNTLRERKENTRLKILGRYSTVNRCDHWCDRTQANFQELTLGWSRRNGLSFLSYCYLHQRATTMGNFFNVL